MSASFSEQYLGLRCLGHVSDGERYSRASDQPVPNTHYAVSAALRNVLDALVHCVGLYLFNAVEKVVIEVVLENQEAARLKEEAEPEAGGQRQAGAFGLIPEKKLTSF
jgi:hypothetical protein